MAPQASFGHPWIRFLRFWEDLIEVWFLMIFDALKKLKNLKNLKKCEKRIGTGRFGGTPAACRRAFGVCKVKQSHAEFATSLGRPVPCEQGAADCYPFGSSADPIFWSLWASALRSFVKRKLKIKMMCLDWLSVKCFWISACFLKVWLVTIAALESLEFGANLQPRNLSKNL